MKWRRARSWSAIGVDVSARRLAAVQLARRGAGWRIASAAHMDRAEPSAALSAAEVGVFAQILDRQGFAGREVTLAVPCERLRSDLLELPASAPDEALGQLARMELARTHKCSPDSFEMAAWTLPSAARSANVRPVMAAACTHADAEAVLEAWDGGGLRVTALDIHAVAAARAMAPIVGRDATVTAILDLTWDAAHLAILLGDTVIYDRTLAESGLLHVHAALTARLEIESDVADFAMFEVGFSDEMKDEWSGWPLLTDARGILATHFTSMLDELRVSISYAQHRYPELPLSRVFLTGWGASIPGLEDPLGSMLGVEARRMAPADLFECGREHAEALSNPSYTVAAGLAAFEGAAA